MDALTLYVFLLTNIFWMVFTFVTVSLIRKDKIEVTVKDVKNINPETFSTTLRIPADPPPAKKKPSLDDIDLQDLESIPLATVAKSQGGK